MGLFHFPLSSKAGDYLRLAGTGEGEIAFGWQFS